jgi:hypothetical protein
MSWVNGARGNERATSKLSWTAKLPFPGLAQDLPCSLSPNGIKRRPGRVYSPNGTISSPRRRDGSGLCVTQRRVLRRSQQDGCSEGKRACLMPAVPRAV